MTASRILKVRVADYCRTLVGSHTISSPKLLLVSSGEMVV